MQHSELIPMLTTLKLQRLREKSVGVVNDSVLQFIDDIKMFITLALLYDNNLAVISRMKNKLKYGRAIYQFYKSLRAHIDDNALLIGMLYMLGWSIVNSLKRERLTIAITRFFLLLPNVEEIIHEYIYTAREICRELFSCICNKLDIVVTSKVYKHLKEIVENIVTSQESMFENVRVVTKEDLNGDIITAVLGTEIQ